MMIISLAVDNASVAICLFRNCVHIGFADTSPSNYREKSGSPPEYLAICSRLHASVSKELEVWTAHRRSLCIEVRLHDTCGLDRYAEGTPMI